MLNLNSNHWIALIFTIISFVSGWYSIVLINVDHKDNKFPVRPTKYQWIGCGFAVGLAILSWIRFFFTLQGEENKQHQN
tara:strand:- start:2572 stop:2808 length:237 start_codon:yes stop_codon:yes gene_type:complete